MTFRCYDDAVAFDTAGRENPDSLVTVTNEIPRLRVRGNPTAFAQFLENELTSHEHEVRVVPASALCPQAIARPASDAAVDEWHCDDGDHRASCDAMPVWDWNVGQGTQQPLNCCAI